MWNIHGRSHGAGLRGLHRDGGYDQGHSAWPFIGADVTAYASPLPTPRERALHIATRLFEVSNGELQLLGYRLTSTGGETTIFETYDDMAAWMNEQATNPRVLYAALLNGSGGHIVIVNEVTRGD